MGDVRMSVGGTQRPECAGAGASSRRLPIASQSAAWNNPSTATGLEVCAVEVVQARRRRADPAGAHSMHVVVELVERALQIGVVAYARSHFDQGTVR